MTNTQLQAAILEEKRWLAIAEANEQHESIVGGPIEVCYHSNDGHETVVSFRTIGDAIGWRSVMDRLFPGFITEWFPR